MKTCFTILWIIILLFLILPGISYSQDNVTTATVTPASGTMTALFDEYFLPKSLRIDYIMAGNYLETLVYLSQMKQEPFWSGSRKNLIDPLNYGTFRVMAFDSASGTLIYTKGFCNLFQEWQGTPEAKKVKKAFQETSLLPFPKKTILFRIEKREYSDGAFNKLFEIYINPKDYFINRENIIAIPFTKYYDSGESQDKVDIAFIAEGYTGAEIPKFLTDAKRISDYWMSQSPYSEFKERFNFYAIESVSSESGVTNPGHGDYVNTSVQSSFYTFDMDRYLTSFDTRDIYDIAANVPYDIIFILVNSKTYGGGGFFNFYGESTVDNSYSNVVSIHEFGHTFAGLADEYYTSEVTYSDFYNPAVEPWEPNISTNVNFDTKWKSMLSPGVSIPTPRTKEYIDKIGLFEGGGYTLKGVYSPTQDCRMNSNEAPGFCPICQEAIRKMIRYYSE
ncbi:MAG: M64 family metallo-endopeptidase [Bacteroidetes bacterium]|nr:M64 family metallo-endopeptidase [Bacteroidota bacterium]